MLVLLAINAVLMLALPAALAWFATRRLGGEWRSVLLGAGAFLASQVVHLPINAALLPHLPPLTAPDPWSTWAFLGLSAGVCEESARWLTFRFGVRSPRWRDAFATGAGHGGVEAGILGVSAVLTFLVAAALQDPAAAATLPEGFRAAFTAQLEPARAAPWLVLLAPVERLGALSFHVAASIVVARSLRNAAWLPVAVLWHAAVDAGVVAVASSYGVVPAEAFVLFNAGIAWIVIYALRDAPSPPAPEVPRPPLAPLRRTLDPNSPAADASRYE